MRRRDLLKTLVIFGTGCVVSPPLVWGNNLADFSDDILNSQQILLLAEISETIIPANKKIPGAKAAGVAPFIAGHLQDCYTLKERRDIIKCISTINEVAIQRFKKDFVRLNKNQRLELLKAFDREASSNKDLKNVAYTSYAKLKNLIVFSFFTSEAGMTTCLRYVPIPGYYKGEIAYKRGGRAWAFN